MSELTTLLSLISGLGAAFAFFWNISDRSKKEGERNQKLDMLLLAVREMQSDLKSARAEIAILKEKIKEQDAELKDLRRALREEKNT